MIMAACTAAGGHCPGSRSGDRSRGTAVGGIRL